MRSAVRWTIGALARPRGEARVKGRSKTIPCPSLQYTTMSHTDTQSRGRAPCQNLCSKEGEPLRMGSTNLCAPPELATRAWRIKNYSYNSFRLSTILFSLYYYIKQPQRSCFGAILIDAGKALLSLLLLFRELISIDFFGYVFHLTLTTFL